MSRVGVFANTGAANVYIYFYSHHGQYGFLSQFYDAPFEHKGASYGTAEKYMMPAKARLMSDLATLVHIMATRTPADAKALGRKISPWNEELWQSKRFGTICRGARNNSRYASVPVPVPAAEPVPMQRQMRVPVPQPRGPEAHLLDASNSPLCASNIHVRNATAGARIRTSTKGWRMRAASMPPMRT